MWLFSQDSECSLNTAEKNTHFYNFFLSAVVYVKKYFANSLYGNFDRSILPNIVNQTQPKRPVKLKQVSIRQMSMWESVIQTLKLY